MIQDTHITANHASPAWGNALVKIGLTSASMYTWVYNYDTEQLVLRCYPMDEYNLIQQADANMGLIQNLEFAPAYSISELLSILPNCKMVKNVADGKPIYVVSTSVYSASHSRLADALACAVREHIYRYPTEVATMNKILATS